MRLITTKRLVALTCGILFCQAGCDSNARGTVLDGDGRFKAYTAEYFRDRECARAAARIAGLAGGEGGAVVTIAELPTWTGDRRKTVEGWMWTACHVAVTAGLGAPDDSAIADAVRAELDEHVIGGGKSVRVVVERSAAKAEMAPLKTRTYIVQPGDTLADISMAFYGAAEKWRKIAEANPAVDFNALKPGTALIVPP